MKKKVIITISCYKLENNSFAVNEWLTGMVEI